MAYKTKEKYNAYKRNYFVTHPEAREKHKKRCKNRRERIKAELRARAKICPYCETKILGEKEDFEQHKSDCVSDLAFTDEQIEIG